MLYNAQKTEPVVAAAADMYSAEEEENEPPPPYPVQREHEVIESECE
jgi:hypothetical protein